MLTLPLAVPPGHADDVFVVSVSGGKDSTATILALRESGIPARYVFADTGWEVQEVYDYLATLERLLGICIRQEESAARAKIDREFEYDERWGGYVWRPILRWTVAEVLEAHHRHGVPVNPLYLKGFSRVGCAPCRNANKTDIRMWAEHFPARIDAVRDLERDVTAERERRGLEGSATFFMSAKGPVGIDEAVAWSRTTRGGRQLPLLRDNPDGGCFRWGMCEPPTREDSDDGAPSSTDAGGLR